MFENLVNQEVGKTPKPINNLSFENLVNQEVHNFH